MVDVFDEQREAYAVYVYVKLYKVDGGYAGSRSWKLGYVYPEQERKGEREPEQILEGLKAKFETAIRKALGMGG